MRTLFVSLILALPLACGGVSASAQQEPAVVPYDAEAIPPDQAIRVEVPATPFAKSAVDDRSLGAIAGRENTRQVALNEQSAAVSRNTVGDNSVTGDARVDDNAFQNMSGFSILNINTGNNVAINAAMTVNISIQPNP